MIPTSPSGPSGPSGMIPETSVRGRCGALAVFASAAAFAAALFMSAAAGAADSDGKSKTSSEYGTFSESDVVDCYFSGDCREILPGLTEADVEDCASVGDCKELIGEACVRHGECGNLEEVLGTRYRDRADE